MLSRTNVPFNPRHSQSTCERSEPAEAAKEAVWISTEQTQDVTDPGQGLPWALGPELLRYSRPHLPHECFLYLGGDSGGFALNFMQIIAHTLGSPSNESILFYSQ